jgi:hypothetical protein
MVVVDGERRFVLGGYSVLRDAKAAEYEAAMQDCAKAGFNLVYVSGSKRREKAEAAVANGLMTWVSVGAPEDEYYFLYRFRERVRRIADTPGLAVVETVDEPAWTLRKPDHRVPPIEIIRAYSIIKEILPDRLVYTNHAPTNLVSTLQAFTPGTDIVAVDVYPVIPRGLVLPEVMFADGLQGDLNNPYISQIGEYVRKMRKVAGANKPVFSVQQAFAWANLLPEETRDPRWLLYPTHHQSRFMAYQAIIEGANGIMYWGAFATPKTSRFWEDLKRVVRELADLEPVLATPSVSLTPEIQYHEAGHSVDDGVAVLVKDIDENTRYLITCNADRYACRATLSGFGAWDRVTVLNERPRPVTLENGTLTDVWVPFDVHVYRLER